MEAFGLLFATSTLWLITRQALDACLGTRPLITRGEAPAVHAGASARECAAHCC
jgi:hypothetical protein